MSVTKEEVAPRTKRTTNNCTNKCANVMFTWRKLCDIFTCLHFANDAFLHFSKFKQKTTRLDFLCVCVIVSPWIAISICLDLNCDCAFSKTLTNIEKIVQYFILFYFFLYALGENINGMEQRMKNSLQNHFNLNELNNMHIYEFPPSTVSLSSLFLLYLMMLF